MVASAYSEKAIQMASKTTTPSYWVDFHEVESKLICNTLGVPERDTVAITVPAILENSVKAITAMTFSNKNLR